MVQYLIDECRANIFERTHDGSTSLMLAVFGNHLYVFWRT